MRQQYVIYVVEESRFKQDIIKKALNAIMEAGGTIIQPELVYNTGFVYSVDDKNWPLVNFREEEWLTETGAEKIKEYQYGTKDNFYPLRPKRDKEGQNIDEEKSDGNEMGDEYPGSRDNDVSPFFLSDEYKKTEEVESSDGDRWTRCSTM